MRRQLDRILTSATFREAGRASAFLRFVVERKLSGRASEIKETIIGVDVLGRNASFDPRLDPIVRTEAGRLRTRLSSYYAAEGQADEIQIVLPKGRLRGRVCRTSIVGTAEEGEANPTRNAIVTKYRSAVEKWSLVAKTTDAKEAL